MGKRSSRAALGGIAASLVLAAPATGFGPQHGQDDPAFDVCSSAVGRQIEAGIQAGGGPKSVDVAPANCDHFWQRSDTPHGALIGNGWPPPPFQD